ncbi:hypothetical protein EV659_104176 [Rhodothalassium salexigens DSM 2132]|uniref:Uncharacterized protein n=1 Tax=Rhodothalassium salexigens DSM 2132 TaxID=1188247 RepID=A0A4R2PMQ0_RHOSA|nr:hypothetical protein [Rhodothalassium salexigens]MBB4211404.1 hypothetical protein [Rhodothalassium salexigens DSM 2132]TCP35325.1 hypothetical protein EV659_104176 [Rhodothalassium salexigens DSM 2132]
MTIPSANPNQTPSRPAPADLAHLKEFEVPCRVAVERTEEFFCAHVLLGNQVTVDAGDTVTVQGDAIDAKPGDRFIERRRAKVRRAGPLARAWTKIAAIFEITELFEVSFTGRRTL